MEELTSPEIGALAGTHRVVFACGATEQHGPHLPLAVDALIGDALAERVARKLGDTLVAPTLRIGCSAHHMASRARSRCARRRSGRSCATRSRACARTASSGSRSSPPMAATSLRWRRSRPTLGVAAYTDLAGMIEAWEEIVVAAGGPPGTSAGTPTSPSPR